MKNFSKLKKVVSRRLLVLDRLRDQLKSGKKKLKSGEEVLLSEKDLARISREQAILKERVA